MVNKILMFNKHKILFMPGKVSTNEKNISW